MSQSSPSVAAKALDANGLEGNEAENEVLEPDALQPDVLEPDVLKPDALELNALDEQHRLAALKRLEILDTAPEIAFDRLTAMAAQIFGAPFALVTLIGSDRQWFKSAYGTELRETPREVSFCAHQLTSEAILVVPDARLDPRFQDNPTVTGAPGVRFYAGARLTSPEGIALGRLCILDTEPREFDAASRQILLGLAALASDELELRLSTRRLEREIAGRRAFQQALKQSEVRFEEAFQHSAIGMALISPQGDYLRVNHVFCRLVGYSEADLMMLSSRALTHPDDLSATLEATRRVLSGEAVTAELEKRYLHRDGHAVMTAVSLSLAQGEGGMPPYFIAQVQDISARRAAETALRQSEARKAAILESALDAIITIDEGATVWEWNGAAETLFGLSREQAVGQKLTDLIVPAERRAGERRQLSHLLKLDEADLVRDSMLGRRIEMPAMRSDGTRLVVESAMVAIPDASPPLFTLQLRDITEQGRIQERLRLLESVAVNAHDAILITQAEPIDAPGPRILYANAAFCEMTGYSLEEVIGQTPRLLQGPDTSPQSRAKIRAALEKWRPVIVEILNYRKDGTPFWVELSIAPVANERGWYTHWVSMQRDVSERHHILDALRESELRYERIAANVPGVVYQLTLNDDGAMKMLFVSEGCREIYGLEPEDVMAEPALLMNHVHPDEAAGFKLSIDEAMRCGQPWEWEGRVKFPGQSQKWIHGIARPKREGDAVIWDGLLLDVTQRRVAEEKLQKAKLEAEQAREEAERANLAKSGFLSRMSHELRTPLNAILGFGQLLDIAPLEPDDAQSATQIIKAGRHLLALINEVLDIARIESGQISLSPEAVRISEIALETLDLVRPLAAARGIRFDDASVRACSNYVLADRQRLKQVLLNLLSNAVKYNREGGVVTFSCHENRAVSSDSTAADAANFSGGSSLSAVRLRVSDAGIGIDPALHERLFTPFDRLGAERTAVEGTGMGLALSKRLAEAMGGHLGFESTPNEGSSFWIELAQAGDPICQLDQFVAPSQAAPDVATQLVVLYIEDNPSNLELVQQLLGHRPEIRLLTAMQGGLGYELARQHDPDLILLDMNLPDVSGAQVLSRLRSDEETRHIPIIVVSADATPGQIDRLLRAGALKYLTKPFRVRELLALLDERIRIKEMNSLCEKTVPSNYFSADADTEAEAEAEAGADTGSTAITAHPPFSLSELAFSTGPTQKAIIAENVPPETFS